VDAHIRHIAVDNQRDPVTGRTEVEGATVMVKAMEEELIEPIIHTPAADYE